MCHGLQEDNMYKGILGGQAWQSVGLRKDGSRAVLWGGDKIVWLTSAEFDTLRNTEV